MATIYQGIYESATQPASHDVLWKDISGMTPIYKYYNGVTWTEVTPDVDVVGQIDTYLLDGFGHIKPQFFAPLSINNTFVVADQAARLALSAVVGDVAVQLDNTTSYILQSLPASTNGNWVAILTPATVVSVNGLTGVVVLDTDDILEGTTNKYFTAERVDDRVAALVTNSTTVAWVYNDPSNTLSAGVISQMSITSDGLGLKLVGDLSTPGNNKFYGTDGSGIKSFYDLPSFRLSAILAANATNTVNHADFAQEWQWNTLSTNTGFRISSTSTAAASNTQKLVEVLLSGANSTALQTTYGMVIMNTHTGTTSSNFGLVVQASGGTTANISIKAMDRMIIGASAAGLASQAAYLDFRSNFGNNTGEIRSLVGRLDIFGGSTGVAVFSKMSVGTVTVGSPLSAPTARLHIFGQAAAAGNGALKLNSGTVLTTPEDGVMEYSGSHLYFTIGATRIQIDAPTATSVLSGLLAATATNTINNANFAQEWQWNTLAATALKLSSTSTAAAGNAQKMLEISMTGANVTTTQSTYGLYISNAHTGTASTNYGIYAAASGGTANVAARFNGDVFLENGTLKPVTDDGAAIGSGTLSWSDLFLASGAVINFNNANFTLTHSAGLLTIASTLGLRYSTDISPTFVNRSLIDKEYADNLILDIAMSSLSAATGINTVNNANYTQTWTWNALTDAGLHITSNSTAANAGQSILKIELSGANTSSSIDTYAAYFSNAHSGINAVNAGIYAQATTSSNQNRAIQGLATDGAENYGAVLQATANSATNIGVYATATGSSSQNVGGWFVGDTAAVKVDGHILPVTSDTGALGSATLMFSDLFLAAGAVINFNNGNFTFVHTTNTITINGSNGLRYASDISGSYTARNLVDKGYVDAQVTASLSLSTITAATSTNTINNLNFAQEWQWNTLAGASAIKLSSTSTLAASNAQKILEIALSGANGTSTQSTYGVYVTNSHTGTSSTNYGVVSIITAGTVNYGVYATATGGTTSVGGFFSGASAAIIANGAILPLTDNTFALGVATLAFADLFLGSGAVLNFNNGNYTVTHSTGKLTFSSNIQVTDGVIYATSTTNQFAPSFAFTGYKTSDNFTAMFQVSETSTTGLTPYNAHQLASFLAPNMTSGQTTDIYIGLTMNTNTVGIFNYFYNGTAANTTGFRMLSLGQSTPAYEFRFDGLMTTQGGAIFNASNTNSDFIIKGTTLSNMFVMHASTDTIGIGITTPTARLHVVGGSGAAGKASIKIGSGTNLTVPEAGAVEFDGLFLYFSTSSSNRTILKGGGRVLASATTFNMVVGNMEKTVGLTNTAARTVNLVASGSVPAGLIVWFKDEAGTGAAANVTFAPNGSDTINGVNASVALIQTNYGAVGFYSDGSGWFTL